MMDTSHSFEIALLLLVAFVIGCLVGYYARRLRGFGVSREPANGPTAPAVTRQKPTASVTKPSAAPAKGTVATKPRQKVATAAKSAASKAPSKPEAAVVTKKAVRSAKKVAVPAGKASGSDKGRPAALSAPRDGKKDDLKLIKGIGPKIEGQLNGLGIYHFEQIAAWDKTAEDWVDGYLSFKGRIAREKWIAQAKGKSG